MVRGPLAALAVCLFFSGLAHPALGQRECRLVLTANPTLSNVTLGGAVTAPIATPLEPGTPGVVAGLQGQLEALLQGPCPTDAAALAAALPGATLSGPTLELYPSQLTVKAGALATLVWFDVLFDASVKLPASSGGEATMRLTVAEGSVNSTSILSPVPETISLVGTNSTNSTAASITVDADQVTVELPGLYFVMPSSYQSSVGTQAIQGATDYVLAGSLVLQTAVGCPADCGSNGRCAAVEGGGVACQCACGWGGAACDIPSGFCPQFSDQLAAAATCPVEPAPAPAPAAPCVAGAACSALQEYNPSTGTCECQAGWEGPQCDACTTDSACAAFYSTATGKEVGATCSTTRAYTEQTVYKAYSCDLEGTGLEDVIESNTFSVGCNTTITRSSVQGSAQSVAASAAVEDGSYCDVNFALRGKRDNPIACRSTLCSFSLNSSRVECATTSCSCAAACTDVQGVLDRIEGQPCVIDCDPVSGQCTFDIQDFFVSLVAPCTNHECLVEGYTLKEGANAAAESTDINPFLAAIPLLALCLTAGVLSAFLLAHRSFFQTVSLDQEGGDAAGLPKSSGAGALQLQHGGAVQELAFSNITSTVVVRRTFLLPFFNRGGSDVATSKTILHGVTGVARRGELVGILGPSGGGKTSLLSILAGSLEDRGRTTRVSGSVTLDGQELDAASARRVAYCAQDSTLLPTLTVEECVRYSAALRLPQDTTAAEVAAQVGSVICEVGLQGVARSVVGGGSGLRGVSGGERRRVTIAMELVTNPPVLVLDEPTSGLDSYTALQLMTTLKQVASPGRIVILSFHQPSPAMFNLLDRAFLMAQGHCVFSGAPAAAEAHFAAVGLPCPVGVAVAEHMLRCAADPEVVPQLLASAASSRSVAPGSPVGDADLKLGGNGSIGSCADAEAGMAASLPPSSKAGGALPLADAAHPAPAAHRRHRARCSLSREVAVLFWRTLVDIARNPSLLLLHWGMALAMGLFVGVIFYQVGLDISGAQNRAGGIFFALAFFAFTSLTTVDLLINERRLVGREVRGGYYSPASYLLSKAVLDGLLLRAIPVFLYSAPFYPMMGLQSGSQNVAVFLLVLSTFAVAVGALSLALAVGCSTAGKASLVMNLVLLLSLLVGGFFVNVASIPGWVRWLSKLSVFFYGYSALITTEVSSLLLDFVVEGYAAVQNVRGTTFLAIIGIDVSDLTQNIIILDCMYLAFLLLAFVLLYAKMPRA